MPPSPLDSPRFFDDAGHSEWQLNNRSASGPRATFAGAKAFARINPEDAWVPPPVQDEAIGVEIVRGANGPGDDGWSVVIDGIRQPLKRRSSAPGSPYAFILPGGVSRDAELSPETRVRSVLVSLRLEEEALQPQRVEVFAEQVLNTTELALQRQPGVDERPLPAGTPQQLQPYRVNDAVANSMLLPYPFWAPAQGALGILSLKAAKRHREVEDSIAAYNLAQTALNNYDTLAYHEDLRFTSELRAEAEIGDSLSDNMIKLLEAAGKAKDFKEGATLSDAQRLVAQNVRDSYVRANPTRPTLRQSKFAPEAPSPKSSSSTIIGGGKMSVARELSIMFEQLARICEERLLDNPDGGKVGLAHHLQRMRVSMDIQGEGKLKSLFDALMTTDPYPPSKLYLDRFRVTEDNIFRKQYEVDVALYRAATFAERSAKIDYTDVTGIQASAAGTVDVSDSRVEAAEDAGTASPSTTATQTKATQEAAACKEVRGFEVEFIPPDNLKQLSAADRQSLRDEIGASSAEAFKKEMDRAARTPLSARLPFVPDYSPPYLFTYDRLMLEARSKTTMRMRIRVAVRDYDGSLVEFVFEAAKDDGIVAHAVYEQLPLDIVAFDYYSKAFTDCMLNTHTCMKKKNLGFVDAINSVTERLRPWVNSKYYRKKRKNRTLQGTDMMQLYAFLPLKAFDGILGLGSVAEDGASLALDPNRLEERIAELRLMVRECLPVWPPVAPTDETTLSLSRSPITTEDLRSADASSEEDPEVSEPRKAFEVTASQLQAYGAAIDDQKRRADEVLAIRFKERFDRAQEQIKLNLDASATMVSLTPSVLGTRQTSMLLRRLPQIVAPTPVSFAFQMLSNMEAPSEDLPSADEIKRRGSFKWVPTIVGTAASAVSYAAFSYGAPLGLAWMVMTACIDANMRLVDKRLEARREATVSATFAPLLTGLRLFDIGKDLANQNFEAAVLAGGKLIADLAPILVKAVNDVLRASGSVNPASEIFRQALQSDLLPLTVNLASTLHTFATRRVTTMDLKKEQYLEHRRAIRGRPVAAAIDAANAALRLYRSRRDDEMALFDSDYREGAVFSASTGKRFVFTEYYAANSTAHAAFEQLHAVAGKTARPWDPVPDGNALRLFPPSTVAEALYTAEALRGIPLASMIAFTAGGDSGLASTRPAELAAKAAVKEIVQVVIRQRRSIKGEHLMQSAGATVKQVAQAAADLLRAAYGPTSGFTSVFGNDPIWNCVRGGTAARLAVRHLSLFHAYEDVQAEDSLASRKNDALTVDLAQRAAARSDAKQLLKSTLKAPFFWNQPRREILKDFTKALVAEAAEFERVARGNAIPLPPALNAGIDSVRRFARVKVLLQGNDVVTREMFENALLLVVSSMAHSALALALPNAGIVDISSELATESVKADTFPDQTNMEAPAPAVPNSKLQKAAWASKRVAITLSRERPIGGGVDEITDLLSGMSTDGLKSPFEPLYYYCPMGSLVQALPGRVPFDTELLERRLVWMQHLEDASELLSRRVHLAPPSTSTMTTHVRIEATRLPSFDDSSEEASTASTGASRHPLVVAMHSNTISVHIASTKASVFGDVATAREEPLGNWSVVEALNRFSTQTVDMSQLAKNTSAARQIAYSAERLWFALSLAATLPDSSHGLTISVPAAYDAAAVAIASAFLKAEYGSYFRDVTLDVHDDAELAQAIIRRLSHQARAAVAAGCKACSLAEVAVSVR